MRYIMLTLSTPYVGTDDYRYLHTDMTDDEIGDYLQEEALSHNESFGFEFSDWMEENAPDVPEDEWDDYWSEYVVCVCECCGWAEVDPEELEENGEIHWEEI